MIQCGMEKADVNYNKRRLEKSDEIEDYIKNFDAGQEELNDADMELINEFLDV